MIGEIFNAVMQETKALIGANQDTVILKTNYKPKNIPSYAMPLVIIEIADAPETTELLGGLTQVEWAFGLNGYNYMLDQYGDDEDAFSTDLLNIPIDLIRQHFSRGGAVNPETGLVDWLAPNVAGTGTLMTDIENNFGFKFTLTGIVPADALDEDGTIMGYRIMFDSIAFDSSTLGSRESLHGLAKVAQVNNPPFD